LEHTHDVKIYYEDTDSLGIVYYANYLKYMERGRTEFINSKGKEIQVWNSQGYNFAVFELSMKFLKPARLGDTVKVVTRPLESGSEYRMKLEQSIELEGVVLVQSTVDIICLDETYKLRAFPGELLS
jgi:tol-pal system-associated acyl-CoA thioesterase